MTNGQIFFLNNPTEKVVTAFFWNADSIFQSCLHFWKTLVVFCLLLCATQIIPHLHIPGLDEMSLKYCHFLVPQTSLHLSFNLELLQTIAWGYIHK